MPLPVHAENYAANCALARSSVSYNGVIMPTHADVGASLLPPIDAKLWKSASDNATQLSAPASSWRRLAQRVMQRRSLRVSVLGSSITAGCGAADPSYFCDPQRAWWLQMHNALEGALGPCAPQQSPNLPLDEAHIVARGKNAVAMDYFTHCTAGWIDAKADLVMLEVGLNGVDVAASVRPAIAAVRAVAEHAIVALIVWVRWQDQPPSAPINGREQALRELAHQENLDVVATSQLARTLYGDLISRTWIQDRRAWFLRWFARNGSDPHPNVDGHALMGHHAAEYVTRQLVLSHELNTPAAAPVPSTASAAAAEDDAVTTTTGRAEPTRASSESGCEVCWHDAIELPVHTINGSWRLVDEGGAKGVVKRGYASERPGDVLVLGPLRPPRRALYHHHHQPHHHHPPSITTSAEPSRDVATGTEQKHFKQKALSFSPSTSSSPPSPAIIDGACAAFVVHLGYLQSTRPGMGLLNLRCSGCICRPLAGFWNRLHFPFPVLETSIANSRMWSHGHANQFSISDTNQSLSVTALTRFTVEWHAADAPCFLELTHAARPSPRPPRSSGRMPPPPPPPPARVRIDTLSISLSALSHSDRFIIRSNASAAEAEAQRPVSASEEAHADAFAQFSERCATGTAEADATTSDRSAAAACPAS